uniref:Uncharacterized protein n=1 Tax=Anopheles albimanus TaxID=7167 RepID=A0A182FEG1_ANOAL
MMPPDDDDDDGGKELVPLPWQSLGASKMANLITVRLQRGDGQAWGFRLQGGKDFSAPLVLQRLVALGGQDAEMYAKLAGTTRCGCVIASFHYSSHRLIDRRRLYRGAQAPTAPRLPANFPVSHGGPGTGDER